MNNYTYNDISKSIKTIIEPFYIDNKNDKIKEVDFIQFLTFLNFLHFLHKLIKNEIHTKNKKTLILLETISNYQKTKEKPKIELILNELFKKISREIESEIDYFDTIKEDIFSSFFKFDYDEIELELEYIFDLLADNQSKEFKSLSKCAMKILTVKDVNDVIEVFNNINSLKKNKYILPSEYINRILPHFIKPFINKNNQNLICLGLSPHSNLESYMMNFNNQKRFIKKNEDEQIEVYFEKKSADYTNLYRLLLNLQYSFFTIHNIEDGIFEHTNDSLVLGIQETTSKSWYKLYDNALKYSTNKAFILIPYSSINTQYRDVRIRSYDDSLIKIYKQNLIKIETLVNERHIEKIVLFPKSFFKHSNEYQVLVQLSKTPTEGIHFIDLDILPKIIIQRIKSQLISPKYLDKISSWDEHKDLIDKEILLSKWVSYDDIKNIHNNNLTINYHLNQVTEKQNVNFLGNYFDVKKIQRFNTLEGTDTLKIFNVSEFNELFSTSSREIKKEIKIKAPIPTFKLKEYTALENKKNLTKEEKNKLKDLKKFRKFEEAHQLKKYDLLIYVHDIKSITILNAVNTYTIGNHNLIRLRVKEEYSKNIEEFSKSLYMFLLSDIGQKSLKKIIVKTKSKRDVISTELIKDIKVDFSNNRAQMIKFNKLERDYKKLESEKRKILNYLK